MNSFYPNPVVLRDQLTGQVIRDVVVDVSRRTHLSMQTDYFSDYCDASLQCPPTIPDLERPTLWTWPLLGWGLAQ